jgi:hypothetical protein
MIINKRIVNIFDFKNHDMAIDQEVDKKLIN